MSENERPRPTLEDVTTFTEDDLRGRVLLPYLESIGLGSHQVKLEQNFTLQLGKSMVVSSSETDRESVQGRLDVLVKDHDGNNLFVVEVKRPDLTLTDDDADQGVSYGRLLKQMPPFVLITNGRTSQLFDTAAWQRIGAEALGPKYATWEKEGRIASFDDLELRYQALRRFVAYSTKNLNLFCKTQVGNRTQILTHGPLSVFSDDIYVLRKGASERLLSFLASDKVSFVLSGPSGFGKSNEMCAFASRVLQDHFVLFFNGAELTGSLLDAIVEEFDWFFSQNAKSERVCERIVDLARKTGKPTLILVDGIDESTFPHQPAELSKFVYRIAQYAGNLKLVVSLKSPEWIRFWRLNGVRSRLADGLYPPKPARDDSARDQSALPVPSYELERFDDDELSVAIEKYKARFKSEGYPQQEIRDELKDPLMLRLFFETFPRLQYVDAVGPHEFEEIVKKYVERQLGRLDDSEAGFQVLTVIAGAIFQESVRNRSAQDGVMELSVLPQRVARAQLRQFGYEDLPNEIVVSLCNFGLISSFTNEFGRQELGFTYERVRDHVLAVHCLSYADDDTGVSPRFLADLAAPATRTVALLHLRVAPAVVWEAFKRYWEHNLRRFLDVYVNLRDGLGPSLRGHIDPYIPNGIRIAYEVDRLGRYVWALGPAEGEGEIVQEHESLGRLMWSRAQSDTAFRQMHGGADFEFLKDPAALAAEHFRNEVVALTERGGLEESNSRFLAIEKAIAILNTHRKRLGLPSERGIVDSMFGSDLFPLLKSDVEDRVHRDWGFEEYLDRFRDDYEMRSLSYPQKQTKARERASEDVSRGVRFKRPNYVNAPPFEELLELLDSICGQDGAIPRYDLPHPDLPWEPHKYRASIDKFYSDDQLVRLIEAVVPVVIREYKRVIGDSFPRLWGFLDLANWSHIGLVLDYDRPENPEDPGGVDYGIVDEAPEAPWVDVAVNPPTPRIDGRLKVANTKHGRLKVERWGGVSLLYLLQPTVYPLSFTSRADRLKGPCWIRSKIYRIAIERIKKLTPYDLLSTLQYSNA